MKRLRVPIVLTTALLTAFAAFGQQIAEEELRGASSVEFVNFEGRRARRYNPQDIYEIGAFFASELEAGVAQPRYARHYTLTHLYDPEQPDLLGADIITIERPARVSHIATIRYLLAGYLESYYGYARDTAETLALFTTYYNAVHRGDMEFFQANYQSQVVAALDPARAGLAQRYDEWAGQAQIVIPLTERAAQRQTGAVDTGQLGDDAVTEELQQRPDRGVEEREQLVEVREEEVEQQEEEIAQAEQELEQQREEIAQADQELEQQREETAQAEQQLEEERQQAEQITDAEERRQREQEIAEREAEILEQREQQEEAEQQIEQQREEVAQREQEVAEQREQAEETRGEIQQEREEIERDQRIVQAQEDPESIVEELEQAEEELARQGEPVARNRLYYLKVNRYLADGHYANDLYAINTANGEVLYKAPPEPHIAGHKYLVIATGPSQGVLVLTHSGDYREAHFLTLLDLDTLEPVITGDTAIFHRSFVEKRGDFFYAINYRGENDYRLGKYDVRLNMVAESEERIDRNTVFHMFGDLVYVNSPAGRVLVLDGETLERTSELQLE